MHEHTQIIVVVRYEMSTEKPGTDYKDNWPTHYAMFCDSKVYWFT